MVEIERVDSIDEKYSKIIDDEFNKYANKNNVVCDYVSFSFVAKENDNIVGIITGHSYYKEIHISDLIVLEQYRNKKIGSKLIEKVEEYYKNKGFENINLTTYDFQAPKFYQKCGFEIEFMRENKQNPKLTKYFLIKHII